MLRAMFKDKSEHEAVEAIQRYLTVSPTYFVLDYIEFAKSSPVDYYDFSPEFEEHVIRLHELVTVWEKDER